MRATSSSHIWVTAKNQPGFFANDKPGQAVDSEGCRCSRKRVRNDHSQSSDLMPFLLINVHRKELSPELQKGRSKKAFTLGRTASHWFRSTLPPLSFYQLYEVIGDRKSSDGENFFIKAEWFVMQDYQGQEYFLGGGKIHLYLLAKAKGIEFEIFPLWLFLVCMYHIYTIHFRRIWIYSGSPGWIEIPL